MDKQITIGDIISVFLGCVVGLALTPIIATTVTTVTAAMDAGAAKTLLGLFPLFWVIFLTAIPVRQVTLVVKGARERGGIGIGDIIKVLLPSVVGVALTTTVNSSVTTALAAIDNTTAAYTMMGLFPLFWVIYLIGIPVTAIAMWMYSQ
jgi:hypothetical protein